MPEIASNNGKIITGKKSTNAILGPTVQLATYNRTFFSFLYNTNLPMIPPNSPTADPYIAQNWRPNSI